MCVFAITSIGNDDIVHTKLTVGIVVQLVSNLYIMDL